MNIIISGNLGEHFKPSSKKFNVYLKDCNTKPENSNSSKKYQKINHGPSYGLKDVGHVP